MNRLSDSSTLVRKKASGLLETLIYQNKVFEGSIKVEPETVIAQKLTEHREEHKRLRQAVDGQVDEQLADIEPEELKQRLSKEDMVIQYLAEYQGMLKLLEKASDTFRELLLSKNATDALGAIDGLVACNLRGVAHANNAATAMLSLIWNREQNVRSRVENAFSNLYLNPRLHCVEEITQNLVEFIRTLSPGKICSLEDLFCGLLKDRKVDDKILKRFWTKFKERPSAALATLLRFTTFGDPSFLLQRYDNFAAITLAAAGDWETFKECLLCFERLEDQGKSTQQLLSQAMKKLFALTGTGFFSVAEQYVKTAYAVSSSPLVILKVCFAQSMKDLIEGKTGEVELARAVFLAGTIAMKCVVHGDRTASKFQKDAMNTDKEDDLDEISGGAGAAVEEKLQQLRVAQENLIFEKPLGVLTPVVLRLLTDFQSIKTETLRKAVIITMGKFMCINSQLCEKYITQFLYVGDTEESPDIRCSAVITVGDLIMRHPNLLESHSQFLFCKLKDRNEQVKKKALLVISHLVLNDMIKVKSYIADILQGALDKELKHLTLVFLQEFHQKDSLALYNLVPDAISRLQTACLSHAQFKRLIDVLFKYIDKERQGENLIGKLSHRFYSCSEEEANNVAYCLTLVPINEKGVRILLDNTPAWQPRATENSLVKEYLNDFASKARKQWKTESKALLEELEAGIRGEEDAVRKRKTRVSNK